MIPYPLRIPARLLLAGFVLLAACGKKPDEAPPEKVTVVTTAVVAKRDLPITESAIGSTTALGTAEDLDPNAVRRGTFTIRLPFPVRVARQLHTGQEVVLSSFDNPNRRAMAHIRQIRPALDSTTQSMEVIAELPGGREWYSMGSVRGEVVLGVHRGAMVIPEQAVVLRPGSDPLASTTVVYAVNNGVANERLIQTGMSRDGEVEVLSGLKPGETIVIDGASQLSEGAKVRLREATAQTTGSGAKAP